MENNIYKSIAQRTGGDIYIGVAGPVRTGKSTLIKQIMNTFVIPNLADKSAKERTVDELPQSAAGKTIMTTEPKFIPEKAASVKIDDSTSFNMRLIDCVGYIVPSASGYIEDNAPRMVMTPWYDEEIPFNMAAETGTKKVITEHSTVGLVVTTDGSFTGIPSDEYRECEKKVIDELKELGKPFAIVLNCKEPDSENAQKLKKELSEKYSASVTAVNCLEINENDIAEILKNILMSFPVCEINIKAPSWIPSLPAIHPLKAGFCKTLTENISDIKTINDIHLLTEKIAENENVKSCRICEKDFSCGSVTLETEFSNDLFCKIISESTGFEISDESGIIPLLSELKEIKNKYDAISPALESCEQTGYGIIMPQPSELSLEEPEIIRQGGKYGVKLKASAPSIHLMKAGIQTTVSPIVGTEKQSEDLINYLLEEFRDSPEKIWESNIFGKSLFELVNEGLHSKLHKMPSEARMKLRETLERVINEGCCGLICFIL